jgi:hypothetical protein
LGKTGVISPVYPREKTVEKTVGKNRGYLSSLSERKKLVMNSMRKKLMRKPTTARANLCIDIRTSLLEL